MAYFYYIVEDGKRNDKTWAHDESILVQNSAWNKYCDIWGLPPEPNISMSSYSVRSVFIVMAQRAGIKAERIMIPDSVVSPNSG